MAEEDLREGEVAAGGFVAHHAHGQSDGPKGVSQWRVRQRWALKRLGCLGQPSLLEGGEGLEVQLASGGAGGLQDGSFELMDGGVATGYGDGDRHGDGAWRRLQTRLSHTVRFG